MAWTTTAFHASHPAVGKAWTRLNALGRLDDPKVVERMITLPLDPEKERVAGQSFGTDGGLAIVRRRRA